MKCTFWFPWRDENVSERATGRHRCWEERAVERLNDRKKHYYLILSQWWWRMCFNTAEKDTLSCRFILLLGASPLFSNSLTGECSAENLGAGLQGSANWDRLSSVTSPLHRDVQLWLLSIVQPHQIFKKWMTVFCHCGEVLQSAIRIVCRPQHVMRKESQ